MFRHGTYYIIANDSDKTLETIIINYANTIGFSYNYETRRKSKRINKMVYGYLWY